MDRQNPHTPDIMSDIAVSDLPDDIMALFDSFQEYYSDDERKKVEGLSTSHQANLSAITSRIEYIDEQIDRLHVYRENLLSKRDQESKNVAVLKSILTPIRRVPMDVLCEIFVRCLPEIPTRAPIKAVKVYEAPLLLCQVCTKWRSIALAFPPLWKALILRASYTFDAETGLIVTVHPSVSPIMDSWFARAGGCSLSLRLDLQYKDEDNAELTLTLEDVLNRLPNSRLQHLALTTMYRSDIYFLSGISQEFMDLESIVLQNENGADSVPEPHRLLQSAPRLHSAELYNFFPLTTFPRYLIPWSQLTHLRVEEELGEKMWYILICHCTNLQHGIFSIDCDSSDALMIPISDHDIILPHLLDLTVHIAEDGDEPHFRQLVFPALIRLQLLYECPNPIKAWDGHLTAISYSPLNNLVILGAIDFTQPLPQSWLNSLPSITELRLSEGKGYASFFKSLMPSSSTKQLLPNLKALHCDIRDVGPADPFRQSLTSFVQSRMRDDTNSSTVHSIARLRRLTLKFDVTIVGGNFRRGVSQILEPFRDQGLSLVVDTWDDDSLNVREMMRYELEL